MFLEGILILLLSGCMISTLLSFSALSRNTNQIQCSLEPVGDSCFGDISFFPNSVSIISGCPWKPRIFPGTTVTQLGEVVSCTFHLFPILSFLIFQIQVDIFMSYFRSLIYFIISMLWIELYPHKIHRLNPNPQSGSLWGQS